MADDMKSGLEELAKGTVQNGAGSEGKGGISQPGAGESQQSKGTWITALPEDLRKGVDAEKYANINEYVRDLQPRVNGIVRDEQAFTEGWDSYLEEMKTSGEMLPESIQKVLKESGVDAETARKLSKAVGEYSASAMQGARDAARREMSEFLSTEWKGVFQKNNETLKEGLKIFGRKHPELMKKANERGSIYTPEFVQLMVDYAQLEKAINKEQHSPEGTPEPQEDASNPYGLKNI